MPKAKLAKGRGRAVGTKEPSAHTSLTSHTEIPRTSRTKSRVEPSPELTSDNLDTEGHIRDHEEGPNKHRAKLGKGTSKSILDFDAPPGLEPTLTDRMSVTFP